MGRGTEPGAGGELEAAAGEPRGTEYTVPLLQTQTKNRSLGFF